MSEKNGNYIIRLRPEKMELKPSLYKIIIGNNIFLLLVLFALFMNMISFTRIDIRVVLMAIIFGIIVWFNLWSIKIEDSDSIIIKRFFMKKIIFISDLIDIENEISHIKITYIENNKKREILLPNSGKGIRFLNIYYLDDDIINEFLNCFEKGNKTVYYDEESILFKDVKDIEMDSRTVLLIIATIILGATVFWRLAYYFAMKS